MMYNMVNKIVHKGINFLLNLHQIIAIILTLTICNICYAQNEIIPSNDYSVLKTLLQTTDQNTLIIFDVDDVIIRPTDEYDMNRNTFRNSLWRELGNKLSLNTFKEYYGNTRSNSQWELVDRDIYSVFKLIEERKLSTISLTSFVTGSYGLMGNAEDWRINQLKQFGFDFSKLSPLKRNYYIKTEDNPHGESLLKSGVIFTARGNKGAALEYVLNTEDFHPKKIIFIDDRLENLQSIQSFAQRAKIDFIGIHYTKIAELPPPNVNHDFETLRFKILENEQKWLSYRELSNRISSSSKIIQAIDLEQGDLIFWKTTDQIDRAGHIAIVNQTSSNPKDLRIAHATDNPKYNAFVSTYLQPSANIQQHGKYYYVIRIKDPVVRTKFCNLVSEWLEKNIPFNAKHEAEMIQWDDSLAKLSTEHKVILQHELFAKRKCSQPQINSIGHMCSEIAILALQKAFMLTDKDNTTPQALHLDPILCPPSTMMLSLMQDKDNFEILGELYIPSI